MRDGGGLSVPQPRPAAESPLKALDLTDVVDRLRMRTARRVDAYLFCVRPEERGYRPAKPTACPTGHREALRLRPVRQTAATWAIDAWVELLFLARV